MMITPVHGETIHTLGAPSCYGQASDYEITGDYQVNFQVNGKTQQVALLHNLDIIQPKDEAISLKKWVAGDMELFYFVPRYTDCHSQEAYLFGVKGAQAFPLSFVIGDQTQDHIDFYPHELPLLKDQQLFVKGAFAAGMDEVTLYTFTLDADNHQMRESDKRQVKLSYRMAQDSLP